MTEYFDRCKERMINLRNKVSEDLSNKSQACQTLNIEKQTIANRLLREDERADQNSKVDTLLIQASSALQKAKQNHDRIIKVTEAIADVIKLANAKNAQSLVGEPIKEAVKIVEYYVDYLQNPSNWSYIETLSNDTSNLLDNIAHLTANESLGDNIGALGRLGSALLAVGELIAGCVTNAWGIFVTICLLFDEDNPGFRIVSNGFNYFCKAWKDFKQALTGNAEPQQLKNLDEQISMIAQQLNEANNNIIPKKPSFFDTPPLTSASYQEPTAPQPEEDAYPSVGNGKGGGLVS